MQVRLIHDDGTEEVAEVRNMKIRLNAGGGLVGYFTMPGFTPAPDVVTWGTRTFKLRPVEPPPEDDCACIYDECFAVAIISERTDS